MWIPAIGEPTEGDFFLIPSIFHRVLLTVSDEFLDHTMLADRLVYTLAES